MSTGVLYQARKKTRTRLNLPLHIIWAGIRDHLEVDMNPLAGMTSSLAGEARGSLEWSSIPRPAGSMMLQKREYKNKKKMITQRNFREAKKLWRLLKF